MNLSNRSRSATVARWRATFRGSGLMPLQSFRFYTIVSTHRGNGRRTGAGQMPAAWAAAFCAAVILGPCALRAARAPEVLRSVAALPPHLAGLFSEASGFHQLRSGNYLVFDRRGHTVYTVDAAMSAASKIVQVG
jgi:hypothetical protein